MDLKQLYQDIILEHGKSPRNFGKCQKYTHEAKGHNPLCGDQVHVYLKLNKDGQVNDLTFEGSGCAISIASIPSLASNVSIDSRSKLKLMSCLMSASSSVISTVYI